MAQSTNLLPWMSWAAGKLITKTGVVAKDLTVKAARGTARLAGECTREFVDGLKDGKSQATFNGVLDERLKEIRLNSVCLGDTDGDLERVMDARKPA